MGKRIKPINVVSWYEKCRVEINNLEEILPTLSIEDKLTHIRQQYVTLAHIDKIFNGTAFFIGVPRIDTTKLNLD